MDGQGAERRVTLVAEEETRGAVNVLNAFNGKLLAGINSKVSGALFLTLPIPLSNILQRLFLGHGLTTIGKLHAY